MNLYNLAPILTMTSTTVNNTIAKFILFAQAIVGAAAAGALVWVAFQFIWGGEEGQQRAKKHLKGIAIGVILCVASIAIAQWFKLQLSEIQASSF